MNPIQPYVNFAGQTEEAFRFYHSVFGGELEGPIRFRDAGGAEMGLTGADLDGVMHISLRLPSGTVLMGTDSLECLGRPLIMGNNVHLVLVPGSRDEAETLFARLSADGQVTMELTRTDWAESYGSFADRFGLCWMISFAGEAQEQAAR